MADKKDDAKNEAPKAEGETAPAGAGAGKLLKLVGGSALAAVALGWILATMAVPKRQEEAPKHLDGPFVARLSKTDIQVNLSGESSKRYLVMMLNAEYMAYDEIYVNGRLGIGGAAVEDPLYTIQLKNALLGLATRRTREQVTDPVHIETFLEEARQLVEPVLFPIHLGDAHSPHHPDSRSGLRLGASNHESTLRGLLHEHAIHVDAQHHTLRFDEGAPVDYEKQDRDLKVVNQDGIEVWIDVTGLKPDFAGRVPIGVPGRLRKIYRESFLVQ